VGTPLLFTEEFELVIMIEGDRRDAWVGPSFLTWKDYKTSRGWLGQSFFR
jgi:hypothetical protein